MFMGLDKVVASASVLQRVASVVLVATLVSAAASAPASAAASAAPVSYVALGDSYTAGPGIPRQLNDQPGCLRSDHNYPHLVAVALHVRTFRDASCIGATTMDMTGAQSFFTPVNPPQFDRLHANTGIVTLQIGGNDIGFFSIALTCATFDPTAAGTRCQDAFVRNGTDEISGRITAAAPQVAAVLRGIHIRSPRAHVYVVGYPAIFPDSSAGCVPAVPITPGDVPYLRAKEHELNAMLRAQAATNNSVFVDVYNASIGHDACQPPGVRWIQPVDFSAPIVSWIHPNTTGMQGMASAVLGAIQAQHQHQPERHPEHRERQPRDAK
jgi:lysophospholipase L1-like esterase